MSLTPYPTLRLKLTMPQALKLQFLPAVPGSNAAAAAAAAQAAADAAQAAANTATAATANKVDKSGDVMTGFLTLNADPNTNLQAATKHYVDIKVSTGGIPEAPSDGVLYGRLNAAWSAAQPLDADLTSLAGASATNQWYYRSAANVWSPVTVGATMTFVGGVLNTTAGGGNVIAVGTPLNGQWARFTTAATIEGVDAANTGFQPLDADLTSLAAASATNVIYYRSAANTWGPVTVGTGLTFTGGTLAATGGGGTGNVSNSGTPTVGQYAKWVTATTIQGVSTATVASDIGAAPVGAEYITSVADATLTAERVLTDTATVTWDRATAGQIKANAAGGGTSTTISDTPPGSPANGSLWWESDTGTLWISYNDGTSTQWVTAAGGGGTTSGLVLLSTVTAAAAASVDFTSLITSAYDEYEVHFSNIYSSSNVDYFLCLVGQSGVYVTTNYSFALNTVSEAATNTPAGGTGAGGVMLAHPALVSSLAIRAISGRMSTVAPLATVAYKYIQFNSAYIDSTGAYRATSGSGAWLGNTNAIDSLRFKMNTGTITGTFKLYGVR